MINSWMLDLVEPYPEIKISSYRYQHMMCQHDMCIHRHIMSKHNYKRICDVDKAGQKFRNYTLRHRDEQIILNHYKSF